MNQHNTHDTMRPINVRPMTQTHDPLYCVYYKAQLKLPRPIHLNALLLDCNAKLNSQQVANKNGNKFSQQAKR